MTARVLMLAPLVLAVAGCGTINSTKAERVIAKAVRKQVGTDVKSVTCPKDVAAKKGDTFHCQVTGADGTKGTAVVTQKDAKGNVRFEAPFVHVGNGERFIAKEIESQVGADVKAVKCPDIVVGRTGGTFDCKVIGTDDTSGTAAVTEKDDKGNINFDAPFIHVGTIETQMAQDIGRQVNAQVKLDCPEIVVGSKGDTFDCDATDDKGNKAKVRVTQKDDQGNVRYKLINS